VHTFYVWNKPDTWSELQKNLHDSRGRIDSCHGDRLKPSRLFLRARSRDSCRVGRELIENSRFMSVTSRVNALVLVSTSASAAIQLLAFCSARDELAEKENGNWKEEAMRAFSILHHSSFSQIRWYVRVRISCRVELPPRVQSEAIYTLSVHDVTLRKMFVWITIILLICELRKYFLFLIKNFLIILTKFWLKQHNF